jgi:hypothetical protein
MPKPAPSQYPVYFQKYIDLVPETEVAAGFANQANIIPAFLQSISAQKATYAYAPGKWTLKEMLQHLIDSERVFAYRALCFARKDPNSLAGFDENEYALQSFANDRSWESLGTEFIAVRITTEKLFESFSPAILQRIGIANNNPTSVDSMGFITLGHFYHHKKIVEERYM